MDDQTPKRTKSQPWAALRAKLVTTPEQEAERAAAVDALAAHADRVAATAAAPRQR
jgi:hypothetical protein